MGGDPTAWYAPLSESAHRLIAYVTSSPSLPPAFLLPLLFLQSSYSLSGSFTEHGADELSAVASLLKLSSVQVKAQWGEGTPKMPFFRFYIFFLFVVNEPGQPRSAVREIGSERSMDEEIELDQDMDGLNSFMTPEMDRRWVAAQGRGSSSCHSKLGWSVCKHFSFSILGISGWISGERGILELFLFKI